MSTFPGFPRLQKGALIGMDPLNPLASVVVFQYNPETLTRTISPQAREKVRTRGSAAAQRPASGDDEGRYRDRCHGPARAGEGAGDVDGHLSG
jgi:hypothetical protein